MSTGTNTAAAPNSETRTGRPRRRVLCALVAVALLLVGLGIGLGVAQTFPDDDAQDVPASTSAAVGFAQDMSAHHAQGVEMAAIVLGRSADTQVRAIAYDIVTTQSNQIGQMQSWLSRWGYPMAASGPAMGWMAGDGHSHGHSTGADSMDGHSAGDATMRHSGGDGVQSPVMPGMAVAPELGRLRGLSGSALDLYFLQLMLRHHQGGLPMMTYAADPEHVSQDYVRDLAHQMIATQTTESDTMRTMIRDRGGVELPMS